MAESPSCLASICFPLFITNKTLIGFQVQGAQLKHAHFQTLLQLEIVGMMLLHQSPLPYLFPSCLLPGCRGHLVTGDGKHDDEEDCCKAVEYKDRTVTWPRSWGYLCQPWGPTPKFISCGWKKFQAKLLLAIIWVLFTAGSILNAALNRVVKMIH